MTFEKAIEKAIITKETINNTLSGVSTGSSTKDLLVASYLSLSMQHHNAIVLLIKENLQSSAAALLRPLLESTYRGSWIEITVSPDDIEIINTPDFEFEKTWKLAKDIDSIIGDTIFYKVFSESKDILNAMVHGGLQQITRQINKENNSIEASFTEEELVIFITSANAHVAMMLLSFGINLNNSKICKIAKSLLIDGDDREQRN